MDLLHTPDRVTPAVIRIPLANVPPTVLPLTRESVMALVCRTYKNPAHEVRVIFTIEQEDGLDIELATVELNTTRNGGWWLQYVSHPAQSGDLTAEIVPLPCDFEAFAQARKVVPPSHALPAICAQELHDEGLGPLAVLNLRLFNPAPVVPTRADLEQLVTLANI